MCSSLERSLHINKKIKKKRSLFIDLINYALLLQDIRHGSVGSS